ncbi:MAG: hypothetical protein ABI972_03560, partial [Acidobacteriota bacterium]
MGLYTLALVIFSGLQVWITNGQLQEMRDDSIITKQAADAATEAAKIAKKAYEANAELFRLAQEPSVSIVEINFMDRREPVKGKPIYIGVDTVNSGLSAARQVQGHFHVRYGRDARKGIGKGGVFPGDSKSAFTIAANREKGFTAVSVVNEDDYLSQPRPWDGSLPIVVWGVIRYRDRFAKSYKTNFCSEYFPQPPHFFFVNCRVRIPGEGERGSGANVNII